MHYSKKPTRVSNRVKDKNPRRRLRQHTLKRRNEDEEMMKSYHSWSVRRYFVLRVWDEEKREGPMHAGLETKKKKKRIY